MVSKHHTLQIAYNSVRRKLRMYLERFKNWGRQPIPNPLTTQEDEDEMPTSGNPHSNSENSGNEADYEQLNPEEPPVVELSVPEPNDEMFTLITMSYILNSPFPPFYNIICCSVNDEMPWKEKKQFLHDNGIQLANYLAPPYLQKAYDLDYNDSQELEMHHVVIAIFRGKQIDVLGDKIRIN